MNKKEKNKAHNFHLVLNNKMKNKLIKLAKRLKLSNSETAIYILKNTLCILSKYQFNIQENFENLGYQYVNWDNNMHIYMDKILYRKIKHLADTIFAFSVSIVVRKLFELYFKFLKIGNNKIERVERVFKRFYLLYVKHYGEKIKSWDKITNTEQLCGQFNYFLKFNDKFTIIGFNYNNSV